MENQRTTPRSATPPLRFASWNLENFGDDAAKTPAKAERIAWAIVNELKSPHILAVQEMCDDSGDLNDGTTSAEKNAQIIIDAIAKAGGKEYRYIEIPPENNRDGGKPGSNIRCGYFYRPDRVALAESIDADQGTGMIPRNPMRLAASNVAFHESRKPLYAQFIDRMTDERYSVVNVHLASDGIHYRQRKGVQEPVQQNGDWIPNAERLGKREQQARIIAATMKKLGAQLESQGKSDTHHFVVCGDFNTSTRSTHANFSVEPGPTPAVIQTFIDAGLINSSGTLAPNAFTHGEGQWKMVLDYLFFSPKLHARVEGMSCPPLNQYETRATRISDHNPLMATIAAPARAVQPQQASRAA